MEILFALMGVFLVLFVLALVPAVVSSVIEEKWRHGGKIAVFGMSKDHFAATQSKESFDAEAPRGLGLWPYGPNSSIGFGGAISRGYVGWQDFKGRANRAEFWWWYLYVVVLQLALVVVGLVVGLVVDGITGTVDDTATTVAGSVVSATVSVGLGLGLVSVILPTLALWFRRLHDRNLTAWWLLLFLVPFGSIVLLVFFLQRGSQGDNRYGSDRLAASESPEGLTV